MKRVGFHVLLGIVAFTLGFGAGAFTRPGVLRFGQTAYWVEYRYIRGDLVHYPILTEYRRCAVVAGPSGVSCTQWALR